MFTARLPVAPFFYIHIAGLKQASFEEEWCCKLKIPEKDSPETEIEVASSSPEATEHAVIGLQNLISQIRIKTHPSHFIALPVIDEGLRENFLNFKRTLLSRSQESMDGYESILEEQFTPENKLHFTLATLTLVNHEEIEKAGHLLSEFLEKYERLGNKPFTLTIKGVGCFQNNLKAARVVFAKLPFDEEFQRLQDLSTSISDFYASHGLHSHNRVLGEPPKLHMTLIKAPIKRPRFCATGLMSAYAGHTFVEGAECKELCLCKMGSLDPGTLFYQREASRDFTV